MTTSPWQRSRYFVLAVEQGIGLPLTLEGYSNQVHAQRAINWQHYGGLSDRREFVIATPAEERGHFTTQNGRTIPVRNSAFTAEAFERFLKEIWP